MSRAITSTNRVDNTHWIFYPYPDPEEQTVYRGINEFLVILGFLEDHCE